MLPSLHACLYRTWGLCGNIRYETCGSRSAAEEIMAGCFYPSNLLVSELLECHRGGRELSQALHLSSSLCLRCKAVAGEHVCI